MACYITIVRIRMIVRRSLSLFIFNVYDEPHQRQRETIVKLKKIFCFIEFEKNQTYPLSHCQEIQQLQEGTSPSLSITHPSLESMTSVSENEYSIVEHSVMLEVLRK